MQNVIARPADGLSLEDGYDPDGADWRRENGRRAKFLMVSVALPGFALLWLSSWGFATELNLSTHKMVHGHCVVTSLPTSPSLPAFAYPPLGTSFAVGQAWTTSNSFGRSAYPYETSCSKQTAAVASANKVGVSYIPSTFSEGFFGSVSAALIDVRYVLMISGLLFLLGAAALILQSIGGGYVREPLDEAT